MLILNIELITRWVTKKNLRTVVSDHLLHIVFIVLKVLYCTLLSERNTSKVILCCLFYLVGLQYVWVKVWISMILWAIYSTVNYRVSFHHLKWVQNGFVIVVCTTLYKLYEGNFCCWWKRVLYLLLVVAATEIFGKNGCNGWSNFMVITSC